MFMKFAPLASGELPGDPDMGGWRPLPKGMFRTSLSHPVSSDTVTKGKHGSFADNYIKLKVALKAAAMKLKIKQYYLKKGGAKFY